MARSKAVTTNHNSTRVSLIRPDVTKKVRMGVSAQAMRLIVDQLTDLYTNPIAATVREVISNAIDATLSLPVDKRRPVEVTSPSMYTPNFVVTDHGVGMSPDTVANIFCQYGESTKIDDMMMIGAKGLGAKAPLSYCNEFTVVTTHDGITTVVTCGRDEEGNYGEILSVEETGQESGTTVTIPLKSYHDAPRFNEELDNFRKNPCDTTILVDGQAANTVDFLKIGEILLDEDENLKGRVWIKSDDVMNYIKSLVSGGHTEVRTSYILSGWSYNGGTLGGYRGYNTPRFTLHVEILPGVVDFSSSRDEITRNDRFTALENRVAENFYRNVDESVYKVLVDQLVNAPVENYMSVCKDLVTGYTPLSRASVATFLNGMLKCSIDDMAHNTGLNLWKMLDENLVPDALVGGHVAKGAYDVMGSERNVEFGASTRFAYSEKIAESVEMVAEAVSNGEASIRLLPTVCYRHLSGFNKKIAIVENADLEAAEIIRRRRSTIVSLELFDLFFLLKGKIDKFTKDSLDALGVDYTVETNTEFVKRIAEARPAPRPRQATTPAESIFFTRVLDDGAELSLLLDKKKNVKVEETDATVDTVVNADGVILMAGRSASSLMDLVRGLLNEGFDFTGRPVYVVNAVHSLSAKEYMKLSKVKDRVYLSSQFRPERDSKAWSTFTDGKETYSSECLLSDVVKHSVEDRKRVVLKNTVRNTSRAFWNVVESSGKFPDLAALVAGRYLNNYDGYDDAKIVYIPDNVIRKTLPDEFLENVEKLAAAYAVIVEETYTYYRNSAFSAGLKILECEGAGSEKMREAVLPMLVEILNDAIIKAEENMNKETAKVA